MTDDAVLFAECPYCGHEWFEMQSTMDPTGEWSLHKYVCDECGLDPRNYTVNNSENLARLGFGPIGDDGSEGK